MIPPFILGKGHFGTVVAVRDTATSDDCVVKLYKRSKQEALLLMKEKNFLLAAKRSGSPYIIQYLDDFMDRRLGYYMIMWPVCRETMEERVRRARRAQPGVPEDGGYDYATIAKYLHEIAMGLEALHEMRIIHCDLALRNILLTHDDHVRLSDMGVGYNDRAGGLPSRASIKKGSFSLAPEMRTTSAKAVFDTSSDCWSFGYCAYLMVCKELPPVPRGPWPWSTPARFPAVIDGESNAMDSTSADFPLPLLKPDRPPVVFLSTSPAPNISGLGRRMCPEVQAVDRRMEWALCEAVVRLLTPEPSYRLEAHSAVRVFEGLLRRLEGDEAPARCHYRGAGRG